MYYDETRLLAELVALGVHLILAIYVVSSSRTPADMRTRFFFIVLLGGVVGLALWLLWKPAQAEVATANALPARRDVAGMSGGKAVLLVGGILAITIAAGVVLSRVIH